MSHGGRPGGDGRGDHEGALSRTGFIVLSRNSKGYTRPGGRSYVTFRMALVRVTNQKAAIEPMT